MFTPSLSERNDFVACMDAIGKVKGSGTLPQTEIEEPEGLPAFDPQPVRNCWITGIAEVAQLVFVGQRMVEVRCLPTFIIDQPGEEFGQSRIFWKMGGIVHPGMQGAKKLCG